MASTYSALKIELIGNGDQSGTWGATTNTNLGTALEETIVGRATANFTSDADLTITLTNVNTTQVARNYILNVTSAVPLTTTRNLIVPTINKPYVIENNTTGSQSIVVKTTAGTGVTVPTGKVVMVYANGTNVVQAFDYVPSLTTGPFSGTTGTFSGYVGTAATGAVTAPVGTTAQRPASPTSGQIRYNTDTPGFEGYGAAWGALGGGNTTTKGMWENSNSITVDYTITTNNNAVSAGPITVASGITVTVPSGSNWIIL